jgi:YHS domain-containing protein
MNTSASTTNLRPWIARALLLMMAVVLTGCASMHAQNPGQGLSPVRADPFEGGGSLMLGGTDVVAYFTQSRHMAGTPQHASVHKGVRFHFASAEHKTLFDAAPERYLPRYNGYCASGIAYAIPWGGSPEVWRVHDGALYIFGGDTSRAAFELDLKNQIALADRYWREEIDGRNSFLQRTWRLVFRVPHYRSDAELAAAVAAARAASGTR